MRAFRIWLFLSMSMIMLLFPLACNNTSDSGSRSNTTTNSITLAEALSNGKPTLAEFGSSSCVPCQQMKPILANLSKQYKDKLNVVFVEVYEQTKLTQQYGIMAIPTQIVFDSNGEELGRHIGFWAEADIIAVLKEIGVE